MQVNDNVNLPFSLVQVQHLESEIRKTEAGYARVTFTLGACRQSFRPKHGELDGGVDGRHPDLPVRRHRHCQQRDLPQGRASRGDASDALQVS